MKRIQHIIFALSLVLFPVAALAVDTGSGAYRSGQLVGRIIGIILIILLIRWIVQKLNK